MTTFFVGLLIIGLAFLFGFLVEAAIAADESIKARGVVFNCTYAILSEVFNATAGAIGLAWLQIFFHRSPIHGLLNVSFSDHGQLIYAVPLALLALFIKDFFNYWFHRFQHSRWLWPEHALHHSDEQMNVTTALRHHWLENWLQFIFVIGPMGLLFRLPMVTVIGVIFAMQTFNYFIHLNARINLGPFLVSPAVHRIHHSRLPEHTDKNFAAVFPIFDIAFGTWYVPGKHQPPTGVAGLKVDSIGNAAVLPFLEWARMFRSNESQKLPQLRLSPSPTESGTAQAIPMQLH